MRIIARRTLREFWEVYPETEQPLKAWFREVKVADWKSPNEVTGKYPRSSLLPGNRIVFRIKGNDYRLVVKVNFDAGILWIRFVGTHAEYDKIAAKNI